jgi:hypothetical protein
MITKVNKFEMDIAQPPIRDTTAIIFYQAAPFCF